MAKAASSFDGESTGVQRGRGGFMRGGASKDTPYISVPSGEVVKSGPRKGEVKRTPYGSPSGFGKLIENSKALEKWGERRVVLGLGVNLALIADCARLVELDVDSDAYKDLADSIIVRAKDAAQANLAADRGTHGHAILEDDDEGRDWISRAEAGELLGIPVEAQHALVAAWRLMLEMHGLEVLVTEASCVDDAWRLAGTLDNLARCTKSLRFRLCTGEVRTIPEGTVLVLDKKTGKRRIDERSGVIQFWHGYIVQVASYAQSKPYDTEAESRGEWEWTIDQDHALIAHIDVLAAIAGAAPEDICTLTYVDIVAGRELGGNTVLKAKEWIGRDDMLSVAQVLDDAPGITQDPAVPGVGMPVEQQGASAHEQSPHGSSEPIAAEDGLASPSSAAALAQEKVVQVVGLTFVPAYPSNIAMLTKAHQDGQHLDVELRRNPANEHDANAVEIHVPALGELAMIGHVNAAQAARLAPRLDEGVQFAARVSGIRINPSHPDRPGIDIAIRRIDATLDTATSPAVPTPPLDAAPPAPAPVGATPSLREAQLARAEQVAARTIATEPPDEGEDLSSDEYASMWDVMRTQFKALERPALDWVSGLIRDARAAGVGFQAQAAHTARRSHIYRGLIALAGTEPSDDALRAVVALALDSDAALFPSVAAGHALGSLDATTARRFAELVDAYLSMPPQLEASFNEDGLFVLRPIAVAA